MQNKKIISIKILFLLLVVSFIGGIVAERYIFSSEPIISYISQDELLELEKSRIASQPLEDRHLFYGKPKEAISLIKQARVNKSNKKHIVVLSQKAVYGKNVKSISSKVHEEILKKLKR